MHTKGFPSLQMQRYSEERKKESRKEERRRRREFNFHMEICCSTVSGKKAGVTDCLYLHVDF
jgi:hypothetical protein